MGEAIGCRESPVGRSEAAVVLGRQGEAGSGAEPAAGYQYSFGSRSSARRNRWRLYGQGRCRAGGREWAGVRNLVSATHHSIAGVVSGWELKLLSYLNT